jgi:hypothetical protein
LEVGDEVGIAVGASIDVDDSVDEFLFGVVDMQSDVGAFECCLVAESDVQAGFVVD